MKKYTKTLALFLSMTLSSQLLFPFHTATAATQTLTASSATSEEVTTAPSESVTDALPHVEESTAEIPTTEEPTTETPTTEEPTTEIPTTEEPITLSPYVVSKLSPVKSKVILLDAGHCKKHLGAHANGLKEEKVVLDITKACQKELNKYGNVTVHMTRTNMKCLKSLHLGDCLSARNNLAKRLDADFLISLHINWDESPAKTGAMILPAYKSDYHDNVRVETQALGKLFLQELHALGVKDNGFWLRTLTSGRYSNGALIDYYSIVRKGVLQNIPSLIVEHGYVSNTFDTENYFRTKKQRKTLGLADANAIVSYYGLKKNTITGTFKKKGKATYYVNTENQKVQGWVKDNGQWYYFSKTNGKMKKGFAKIGKQKFYFNPSTGAMTTGWFTVKGATYLAKGNGTLVRKQAYSDGVRTYLFASSGKKYTKGKHKINGKVYYVNAKTGAL